jgi:membrane protease YdiL (CAAX protease family)
MDPKRDELKVFWFIGIVLLLSWTTVFFIQVLRLSRSPMATIMIFPMILAAVFILVSKKDRFSNIGWKLPNLKFMAVSVFLPIVQMAAVIGLNAALGQISYNEKHILAHKPTSNVGLNLALCLPGMFLPFVLLSLPNFIVGWINHLSEEFAWRGYLFRTVSRTRKSYLKGALISGIVWWAWHLPMFWLSPVLTHLRPGYIVLTIIVSFFALLGTTCIYSWIYLQSGSIWTPTIMHFSWNLFRGILTGRLADGSPGLFKGDLWVINGEGLIGNVVSILVGGIFLYLIVRLDRKKFIHL